MTIIKDSAAGTPRPHDVLQPSDWRKPRGYANGLVAQGRVVFLGGQIGWDEGGKLADGMVRQIHQALRNIAQLLAEANTDVTSLVRLTWYVTDMEAYTSNLKMIGAVYRDVFGFHYPTMSLVQVVRLVEAKALVEIEATAVIGE